VRCGADLVAREVNRLTYRCESDGHVRPMVDGVPCDDEGVTRADCEWPSGSGDVRRLGVAGRTRCRADRQTCDDWRGPGDSR